MRPFPNELLELVLKDVCEIDDEVFEFAYEFHWSPQTDATRIAPLLVCWSWHNVAFSSFYRTTILRTVEHAGHFARILSGHPDLGNHVRKIFFNGAFGSAACNILQATPHITHLRLSFAIKSSNSTKSLCNALHLIQPRSLRLRDFKNTYNNIHQAICTCMQEKWTRLVEFRFPYEVFQPLYVLEREWQEKEFNRVHLLEAMLSAPFLKITHAWSV